MSNWLYDEMSYDNNFISSSAYFNKAFALKETELLKLYKLFVDPTFVEILKSFFADPTNAVSHLLVYPFEVPTADNYDYPLVIAGENSNVMGRLVADVKTWGQYGGHNIPNLKLLFNNYIPLHYNDFRDYNGFTNISCFLPFLGEVEVPTNEVMGKYLRVHLAIDYYSGIGMYFLTVGDTESINFENDRLISKHRVQIAIQIPMSKTNALEAGRNAILAGVKIAASVAVGAYTGTLGGVATATTTTTYGQYTNTLRQRNPNTNRLIQTEQRVIAREPDIVTRETGANYTRNTLREISDISNSLVGNYFVKAETDKTMSPTVEQWASRSVKIIIKRPVYVNMGEYRKYLGSPLYEVRQLKNLYGYTEIGSIHLEGFDITNEELDLLEKELTSGIIL